MSGPDLNNEIFGTIMRLYQKPVGIIDNIETMFYQVLVLEDNRCLLKFPWWKGQDINGKTIFWNLCLSVTGSTAATNSCNCSLQSEQLAVTRQKNYQILQILWRWSSMFMTFCSQWRSVKDTAAVTWLHQYIINICGRADFV